MIREPEPMRRWIESAKRVMPVLLAACQPLPSEVETAIGASASGSSSTTAATGPGTSAPGDATVAASGDDGISEGPLTDTVDPSSGDADSTGEPTDEPLGMFGDPVLVPELSDIFYSDDDPTLTADMLEIYFGSNRGAASEDVWMSTRDTLDAPWDVPVPVASVNTGSTESLVEVSGDGLLLLLASDRLVAGDFDVYFSQRSDRSQAWPAPMPLPGAANPGISDIGATPSPDLASVFLCRAPAGFADIYHAQVDFDLPLVGTAALVNELYSDQDECSVSLSQSGRELFIESSRPTATLGWNLWAATREDPEDTWDVPMPVGELNSHSDDLDPWLSPDRRTLWFASSRTGQLEIYVATRN
jgi:hypothetical protein